MKIIYRPKRLNKEDIKIEAISSIQTIRKSASQTSSCCAPSVIQEIILDSRKLVHYEEKRKRN